MLEELLQRLRQRDRLALSRLLTFLARGQYVEEILSGLGVQPPTARVIAVTGSGGVGKSSLIGKLIERLRAQGKTVAVLACDPESPLSGGALLGDRFRMPSRPDDDGVFIRSLAAASGQGAVAKNLPAQIRLLEAFGFDLILLETVGAGQGDTAVQGLADAVLLLLQPETGDDLQWEKAGVMEVADVVAIHKADLPGAESAAAQVRAALDVLGAKPVPVLRVSARTGQGLDELIQVLLACPLKRAGGTSRDMDLLGLALRELGRRYAQRMAAGDPQLLQLVAAWQRGDTTRDEAVSELLRLLGDQRNR